MKKTITYFDSPKLFKCNNDTVVKVIGIKQQRNIFTYIGTIIECRNSKRIGEYSEQFSTEIFYDI